jgi:hypothetical protein
MINVKHTKMEYIGKSPCILNPGTRWKWSVSILGHVKKYLCTGFIQGTCRKRSLMTGKKSEA